MTLPAVLHVDLDAIRDNLSVLSAAAGDATVMAVVKGNAYGHGLVPVARAALQGGAGYFGVAQLAEAITLRQNGVEAPLVSWLHVPGQNFDDALALNIELGVPSATELQQVRAAANRTGRTARVHLKIDTGLGRNGAYGPDWDLLRDEALAATADGSVEVVGLFSHLACADEPGHPANAAQTALFAERAADAQRAGLRIPLRHLANSAGTLALPQTHWDMVRVGIAMYGYSPGPGVGDLASLGLRPAMTLEAGITVRKRVPAGQGVSYGLTYVTDVPTTLIDVPVGYADGLPRSASSLGPVSVGGRRFRIAGRVCMDQVVVDVGDLEISDDTRVIFFGNGRDGTPTAQDWADTVETIPYEIITAMSDRLPRTYSRMNS